MSKNVQGRTRYTVIRVKEKKIKWKRIGEGGSKILSMVARGNSNERVNVE